MPDDHENHPRYRLLKPALPRPVEMSQLLAAKRTACTVFGDVPAGNAVAAYIAVQALRDKGHTLRCSVWAILELVEAGGLIVHPRSNIDVVSEEVGTSCYIDDPRPRFDDGRLIPDGPVPLDENQPADWRLVRLEPNHIVLDQVFQEVREDLAVERHPASAEGQETCAALQIDPERFTVCWNAKCPVEIGNRKEFHLLQALHTSEGRYVGFADLAEQLGGESFDDIKPVMSRLRKLLKDAGYEDLAACIKTQKGHYGLFLPRNPKVNGAQS